jgi:hypothetical protein
MKRGSTHDSIPRRTLTIPAAQENPQPSVPTAPDTDLPVSPDSTTVPLDPSALDRSLPIDANLPLSLLALYLPSL